MACAEICPDFALEVWKFAEPIVMDTPGVDADKADADKADGDKADGDKADGEV